MDLETFQRRVCSLDLSKYPNVVKNWRFRETKNCLIAECDSNAPLLKGKGYSIYFWKEDLPRIMQLIKVYEMGNGSVLEEFDFS